MCTEETTRPILPGAFGLETWSRPGPISLGQPTTSSRRRPAGETALRPQGPRPVAYPPPPPCAHPTAPTESARRRHEQKDACAVYLLSAGEGHPQLAPHQPSPGPLPGSGLLRPFPDIWQPSLPRTWAVAGQSRRLPRWQRPPHPAAGGGGQEEGGGGGTKESASGISVSDWLWTDVRWRLTTAAGGWPPAVGGSQGTGVGGGGGGLLQKTERRGNPSSRTPLPTPPAPFTTNCTPSGGPLTSPARDQNLAQTCGRAGATVMGRFTKRIGEA